MEAVIKWYKPEEKAPPKDSRCFLMKTKELQEVSLCFFNGCDFTILSQHEEEKHMARIDCGSLIYKGILQETILEAGLSVIMFEKINWHIEAWSEMPKYGGDV